MVPIHPARGAVIRWCDLNRGEMVEAVTHFKRKYRVTGETYRYTEEGATAPTLQQVQSLPSGLFSQLEAMFRWLNLNLRKHFSRANVGRGAW